MSLEQIINSIIIISVFGLVFSIWCICVFLWLGQYTLRLKTVQKRLGITIKESDELQLVRLWRDIQQDAKKAISSEKLSIRERLERLKHDAGWRSPTELVLLGAAGAVAFAFILTYILSNGLLLALGISAVVMTIFWSYMLRCISKRTALFERQFVDALGIAARSLRAGHPLIGAFQLVSREIDEPLGGIFYRICQEQALGFDLKDSIRKIAKTTSSQELKLFATSVAIQLHSGGNLADLMDSLSAIVRARMRLQRRIRVLTAQTQFSKRVLIALPIVLFFLLNYLNAQYMQAFYTTTAGRYMLAGMIVSILIGWWVMNRVSILRF